MQIIFGNLSVLYEGRGYSTLPPLERMVMIKEDGSVSVHNEKSCKAVNYMTGPTELKKTINEKNEEVWTFSNKKETIEITFHMLNENINVACGLNDPGTTQLGSEKQLQEWLSKNLSKLDPQMEFVEREFQTGAGPVDILARNISSGALIAIEVKRNSAMTTVGQLLRYMDAIEDKYPHMKVEGAIAAVEFKKSTLTLAEKKDVKIIEVPKDWIKKC